jgi:hypothetical protein
LLFVFIATIACCLYLTCFFALLTIAISSMLCYYTMGVFFFLSVLNIIYVLDLESVLFDSKSVYNVLLLTCSISYSLSLYVDLWNANKISISIHPMLVPK